MRIEECDPISPTLSFIKVLDMCSINVCKFSRLETTDYQTYIPKISSASADIVYAKTPQTPKIKLDVLLNYNPCEWYIFHDRYKFCVQTSKISQNPSEVFGVFFTHDKYLPAQLYNFFFGINFLRYILT